MNKVTVLEPAKIKSLNDVKSDMSELYEQVKAGTVEIKLAAELANITGKYLKAEQLELAREIFTASRPEKPKALTDGLD